MRAVRVTGAARRRAWLESHPGEVRLHDIERVLLDDGLSARDVRLVVGTAERLGTRPFTMWMFLTAYGVRALAVAVAAEMSHDEMLDFLSDGALPPFDELAVFARLRGLEAASGHLVA